MNLFLSTPSARRATSIASAKPSAIAISIHALREEGDDASEPLMSSMTRFLSTPSARRATRRYIRRRACCRDFYPRPPRGGRRMGFPSSFTSSIFLSTPSARRATRSGNGKRSILFISIHALREEGDGRTSTSGTACCNFYPRPPRGGRQTYLGHFMVLTNFYPRPPRGGRPIKCKGVFQMTVISIHALREEGD